MIDVFFYAFAAVGGAFTALAFIASLGGIVLFVVSGMVIWWRRRAR